MVRIIDYKAGNAPSVLHAAEHLGFNAALASRPDELSDASHIILPGVGSARATMESLRETGFISAMEDAVLRQKKPFLGICVGLQILFEHSEEEDAYCLGWLQGRVVKFTGAAVRVPQMGWNQVRFIKDVPFPAEDDYFYFVNSYYARPDDSSDIWGTADYNGEFAAAVRRDNIYAAQFHIEKSGEAGLSLLRGFLGLKIGGE